MPRPKKSQENLGTAIGLIVLGGVIILLLWFYLTAYVILAGAELNAEIERQTPHP